MKDQLLIDLIRQGFLPSSNESEGEFLKRVEKMKKNFLTEEKIPPSHWEWSRHHLRELFDLDPCYVSAHYSNRSLAPWQGAASWFEGGKLVAIQLRKSLKKGSFLGLYQREEILSHEAIHALRGELKSKKYEEYFAYMSSEKKWRRALGPIFRAPWEVWPLLVFLAAGALWEWSYLFATIWVGIGFFRLIRGHLALKRAAKELLKVVDDRSARAILVRLTDQEIDQLSKGSDSLKIATKQSCLRWRAIRLIYFSKESR